MDGLITFCSHWINREISRTTMYDDFKVIIAYRVDDDSDGTGVWLHESDFGISQNLSSDNPSEVNENKNRPFFFIQRNLIQGTDDETTYDSIRAYKEYSKDEVWDKQTYGLNRSKEGVLTFKGSLSHDIRGRGELSVLPKNPVIWADDTGAKSIVYLGGNFGLYRTNSKMSSKLLTSSFMRSILLLRTSFNCSIVNFISSKTISMESILSA